MPLLKLNFNQFVCGAERTCFVGLLLGFVDDNTLIIIHYCIILYHIRTYVYTIQYIFRLGIHYVKHYMYAAQTCHCMHRHSK